MILAYASAHGAAFIDRALYLPREGATDQGRRAAASVPAGTRFARKITVAERMLARAVAAGVPARWVVADPFSGRSGPFRHWLEERDQPYAVMIPRTNAIDYRGRRIRGEHIAAQLPASDSSPWRCRALSEEGPVGMGRWLLIRRDAEELNDDAGWLADGPAATRREELVRVCAARWQVEECFAQAKGDATPRVPGHGSVRGPHLDGMAPLRDALPAHASLSRRGSPCCPVRGRGTGGAAPGVIPLTVPETRRLVLAMAGDETRRPFHRAWSHWRRAHQAGAARGHAARRALQQQSGRYGGVVPPLPPLDRARADAEGERIRPLLPPQRAPTGRPRHDHRTVLNGILAVVGPEGAWREIPKEYGRRDRVYKRSRLWCDPGLWPRIIAAFARPTVELSL